MATNPDRDSTLTVTSKGQITLRRDLLQHLGVANGAKLTLHKLPNGRIELEAAQQKGSIADVFGFLRRDGQQPVSIDEMNEAIEAGWSRKT